MANTNLETILFNMLVETRVGTKDPDLLQYLMKEIGSNDKYMEHLAYNPRDFKVKFMSAQFLQMLANKYYTDKKKREQQEREKIDTDEPRGRRRRGDQDVTYSTNDDYEVEQTKNQDTDSWLNGIKGSNVGSNNTINANGTLLPINENVLPEMDNVFFLIYNLSLSLQYDLMVFDSENLQTPTYEVRFVKYGNISKIGLSSIVFKKYYLLDDLPYIYIKFDEINGKCYTSKKTAYFGKLVLKNKYENDYQYVPDHGSCIQTFSSPIELDKLTVSFYDPKNNLLALQEIIVDKKITMPKSNKIKLSFLEKHELYPREQLIIRTETSTSDIDEYEINEYEILDDKTIQIDTKNNKIVLSDIIKMYRKYLNCHMTIDLYEINRMLINGTDKNAQSLIKLSNIIKKLSTSS